MLIKFVTVGRHVICTVGRVTGNKIFILFGLMHASPATVGIFQNSIDTIKYAD